MKPLEKRRPDRRLLEFWGEDHNDCMDLLVRNVSDLAAHAISTTGWYTFEHHFFDNGGVLGITMSVFDAANTLINDWSPGGGQAIATVGGNRYGWFDFNQLPVLAFDNAELRTADAGAVPEPMTLAIWSLMSVCGLAYAWRSHRRIA